MGQIGVADLERRLGSDRLDVRLGAIYALERIMIDSARDHPAIVEVLAAFVRECPEAASYRPDLDSGGQTEQHPRPVADLQAAVTVLGRRPAGRTERGRVNLASANLARADLTGESWPARTWPARTCSARTWPARAWPGANLTLADLSCADLAGADLADANLTLANLTLANLARADLAGADLTEASLDGADLTGVTLTGEQQIAINAVIGDLAPFAGPARRWLLALRRKLSL